MSQSKTWEIVADGLRRVRVPSGWLYDCFDKVGTHSLCLVPYVEETPVEVPPGSMLARAIRVVVEANLADGLEPKDSRPVGYLRVHPHFNMVCARGAPDKTYMSRPIPILNVQDGWIVDGPWVAELERDIDALQASIPTLRAAREAREAEAKAKMIEEIMEQRRADDWNRGRAEREAMYAKFAEQRTMNASTSAEYSSDATQDVDAPPTESSGE